MAAKVRHFWRITKLMGDFLLKIVKSGLPAGTVTEQSRADALPIASPHGEGLTSRDIVLAIEAIEELVAILLRVVRNAKPHFRESAFLDQLPLPASLYADAIFAQADSTKQLARAEEPSEVIARGRGDQRRTLTQPAYHLLREHVAAGLQTVGRHGLERKKAFAQMPMGGDGIVIPLPLQA